MAMGTPIYALLFYTLPPTRAFTPVRILCLFAFSAVVLASMGLEAFQENKEKTGWIPWAGLVIIILTGAFLGFVIYNVQNRTPWFNNTLTYYLKCGVIELPNNFADRSVFAGEMLKRIGKFYRWENVQLTAPLILGMIGVLVLFLRRAGKITRNIFITAVFAIVMLDLFPIAQRYNPAFPRNSIYPKASAIEFLKKDNGIYRICGWKRSPHPNTLTAYEISEINGYSSMYPSRVRDLFYAINGGSLPSPILCVMEKGTYMNRGLAKLMGIKYFYNNPGGEAPPSIPTKEIYRKDLSIFLNRDEIKRAFIVKDYEVNSPGEILKKMLSPDFDPEKVVYLEEKPDIGNLTENEETSLDISNVKITHYSSGRIEIDVNSSTDGFLVLTDTFYPGWKASIDNKPVKVFRADFFARAVFVRAGDHKVVFSFKPNSLRTGFYITIVSGLILSWLIFMGFYHRVVHAGSHRHHKK